jgi:DNA-binding NarL/FixJ family response regulator
MRKTILIFSLLIIVLLLLFQLSKYSIVFGHSKTEAIIAMIAVVFFAIGFAIQKRGKAPEQKHNSTRIDYEKIKVLQISDREYEVLKGISDGLSNKEIAERLFLSESTIKTHISNLLLKLNAKRRTQALQIAQSLHII